MSVIRSYNSGPHFPVFQLNTDQNNSEYGHILRSDIPSRISIKLRLCYQYSKSFDRNDSLLQLLKNFAPRLNESKEVDW